VVRTPGRWDRRPVQAAGSPRSPTADRWRSTGYFLDLKRTEPIEATHRINDQIRISPVRLVSEDGQQLGIVPTAEAQKMALEAGLDLVEVAPNVRPPVCRIMDYGKFKYEQKKKQTQSAKQHQQQLKEIRLRPKTGDHDIDFKVKQARSFLENRDKVKVNVLFRGRENAHHEKGKEILMGVIAALGDIAKVEAIPRMDSGRSMSCVLTPK
jgi:translation initiation factor IF-3